MDIILFHGTNELSQNNIVNSGIDVNLSKKCGDFGKGFYLTPELDSAKSIALRKSFQDIRPAVVELTLKKEYNNFVKVKSFGNLTLSSSDKDILEWAQFIVNNRCGIDYINKVAVRYGYEENNLDKRYDMVVGTIADGSITKVVRLCNAEKRLVSLTEAKGFLNKSFGIQYCICTVKGLSAIDKLPRKKKGVSWR